jgi:hypothetical protein
MFQKNVLLMPTCPPPRRFGSDEERGDRKLDAVFGPLRAVNRLWPSTYFGEGSREAAPRARSILESLSALNAEVTKEL